MSALAPLRIPAFRRLAGAYAISRLGDVLAIVALAVAVYDRTHSTFATMGLFVALEFLPALAAPALTARLDRIPVRRVLPVLYLLEAGVFCVLAALTHSFSLAPFLALVALDGALGVVARALCRGAVAGVLEPRGQLREGNALLNMALAPNMVIGGVIGATLVASSGTSVALLANAGTFAFGALALATARGLPLYEADDEEEEPEHWRQRLAEAVSYLRANRLAFALLMGQAAALVFFALTEPIEVAYTRDSLDAGPGGYGVLIATWGAGVMAGSVIYTWVGARRLAVTTVVATVVQGIAYLGLAAAPTIEVAGLVSIVGGAANGAQLVAIATAIQETVSQRFQMRVMSFYEALSTAAPGVGYLLGGALGAAFGGRAAFAVAGCGVLAVVLLVAAARPWRRLAPAPAFGRWPAGNAQSHVD
jgi:MFS family permease